MKMRLSRVHYPVTVLGYGKRIGIWVQGCSIGCPFCISQDTWIEDDEMMVLIDDILTWSFTVMDDQTTGITISGGEPFDQTDALLRLLQKIHALKKRLPQDFDILCYSGYPLQRLKRNHPEILSLLDVLIAEPYMHELPRGNVWRGSSNQTLTLISDLAKKRYRSFSDQAYEGKGDFQICVSDSSIYYIGIPDRGDMDSLSKALSARGIDQKETSWKP